MGLDCDLVVRGLVDAVDTLVLLIHYLPQPIDLSVLGLLLFLELYYSVVGTAPVLLDVLELLL